MVIRKLTPQTLDCLTQKDEVEPNERFYVDVLYLGKFDSEDNYREATEEEKIEWENSMTNYDIV